MNKEIKQYLLLILIASCSTIFVILLVNILANEIIFFDNMAYNFISKFIKEPLTNILRLITNLAGPIFIITFTTVILIICKDKKYGIYIIINLVFVTLINQILKIIIQRQRPSKLHHLIEERGYSFPSGHSMVSMAFYGLLIYLAYTKIRNNKLKWITCILLGMLIITIGISRIYLGVHYASDVLGGFTLTLVYLYMFIKIFLKTID